MNKAMMAVTVAMGLAMMAANAHADSFTGGYTHINAGQGDKMNGTNVKYQHRFRQSDFGFIASGTFATNKENTSGESYDTESYEIYDSKGMATGVMSPSEHHQITYTTNSTYMAVSGGPSYALTDDITVYGTVGYAFAAATQHEFNNGNADGEESITESAPTYGAGIQWNVWRSVVLDASYEGTKLFGSQVNTFTVGGGIKF